MGRTWRVWHLIVVVALLSILCLFLAEFQRFEELIHTGEARAWNAYWKEREIDRRENRMNSPNTC